MRVKFIRPMFTGVRTYAKGEVVELHEERAKRAVEDGYAVPAPADQTPETATLKNENETATKGK